MIRINFKTWAVSCRSCVSDNEKLMSSLQNKKKIINTCRWHIKEWTILRHASADVGAFVVIFWKPSTSPQELGSNLSMVVIEKGTKSAKRFQKKILLWNLLSSHTIISFWNLHLVNIKTDDWSVASQKTKTKQKKLFITL